MQGMEIELQALAEIAVAALLGGLLGIEREISDKPAGFRTLMLVAAGSALFVQLGEAFMAQYQTGIDPGRVIQAIVTGIAFLGAGTIIRRAEDEHVEGLTTAALILVAAGIGICSASSLYVLAIGMTVLTLIILVPFRWLVRKFLDH